MRRKVERVVTAHRQREGGGFVVRRPFPTALLALVDPFLLLDEMGPADYGPGEAKGAPDHPHRGFDTVTYMLEGQFEHDSAGNKGAIAAGDVQWMTARSGVVHSEMPAGYIRERKGRIRGFQVWVNLPARDKMMPPRYQEVPASRIPQAATRDGRAHVLEIAGEALGVRAVIDTRTPIAYQDWSLNPGGRRRAAARRPDSSACSGRARACGWPSPRERLWARGSCSSRPSRCANRSPAMDPS
jgi:redox-sensitive bicupin YhaK (pirin superfamily)